MYSTSATGVNHYILLTSPFITVRTLFNMLVTKTITGSARCYKESVANVIKGIAPEIRNKALEMIKRNKVIIPDPLGNSAMKSMWRALYLDSYNQEGKIVRKILALSFCL